MKVLSSFLFLAALLSLPAYTAEPTKKNQVIRIDFSKAKEDGDAVTGWSYKGKLGTDDAKFSIRKIDGDNVLCMTSRDSTGSLLYDLSEVDISRYPYMRWKWRVDVLPTDADGCIPEKDDQAIGIYIGSGSTFSQESIAYRWETRTPKGKTGFVKYGMGAVKVHWVCVRNQQDGLKKWLIDECNLGAELKKIFKGTIPRKLAITISANSQYTGTASTAYLSYIEFSAVPFDQKKAAKGK